MAHGSAAAAILMKRKDPTLPTPFEIRHAMRLIRLAKLAKKRDAPVGTYDREPAIREWYVDRRRKGFGISD